MNAKTESAKKWHEHVQKITSGPERKWLLAGRS
jgi:hypothetical protein